MPYEQRWIPAPKDESLIVHKELPDGVSESRISNLFRLREAYGHLENGDFRTFHFCQHCGGWIEGNANEYHVSNLGLLSGRRGTEYYCRRCGREIAFSGLMS